MTNKFNPLNGKPKWLEDGRDISHTSEENRKHYLRSLKYYRKLYQATPPWYNEDHHKRILAIYKERDRLRKRCENVVVDHIIPVCSDMVCGLNVPWNYQIITEKENAQKSNKYWPDMPFEQRIIDFPEVNPQLDLFK